MSFLQGKLHKKEYIKNGLGLIEMIIVTGLTGTLLASQIAILSKVYLQYNEHSNHSIENMYVNEAFRIIENEISNDWKDIAVSNNSIMININDKNRALICFVNTTGGKGNIVIKYYKNNKVETSNYLIKNIKYLEAYSKGSILYLTIYGDNEREYNRCIVLEKDP